MDENENVDKFILALNLSTMFKIWENFWKIIWEVWIGFPMLHYLKLPLGLMNLPKGLSLGSWEDYQKLGNGNGALSSYHHRPLFFFLFSSSFCFFSFSFSFFLPLLLLYLLFFYFYLFFPLTIVAMKMMNMVGNFSPYPFFTFKLKPQLCHQQWQWPGGRGRPFFLMSRCQRLNN
jgi:hypothetical protein